ncbi:MAG: class I SAM-dependent methyltransferase [Clostridiales bacterium]|nr:class I SAM-dependent methyltransferase [Clostridiales bacterium]
MSNFQIGWFIKNLSSGPLCLEVGCGTGRITKQLVKNKHFTIAVDGSIEMIKINKKTTLNGAFAEKVAYIMCDASHLPFRSECFDDVIGSRVFWHIPDFPVAFADAMRVSRKSGFVLFDFPNLTGPFSAYSKIFRARKQVLTKFITKKSLQRMFKKHKQIVIRNNVSFILYFIPNIILNREIFQQLTRISENFNFKLFNDFLYSYYLVKIQK